MGGGYSHSTRLFCRGWGVGLGEWGWGSGRGVLTFNEVVLQGGPRQHYSPLALHSTQRLRYRRRVILQHVSLITDDQVRTCQSTHMACQSTHRTCQSTPRTYQSIHRACQSPEKQLRTCRLAHRTCQSSYRQSAQNLSIIRHSGLWTCQSR